MYFKGQVGGRVEYVVYDSAGTMMYHDFLNLDHDGAGFAGINLEKLGVGRYIVVASGGGVNAKASFAVVRHR